MVLDRRLVAGAAALFTGMCAATAQADPLTSVAGGLDVFGQGLGEAGQGGPYVFVTATGHAPMVAITSVVLRLGVKSRNSSAVTAVRDRDRAAGAVVAQAQRLGLQAVVGKTSLGRGPSSIARVAAGGIPPLATTSPQTGVRPPPAVQDYTADAEIDVSGPNATKQAELLDSLQAAGIEADVLNGPIVPAFSIAGFSAGAGASVDSASADRAMDDAVAEARRQAARLAADAGRTLGPAVQITLLARSATGREAAATVAVRFALAPQH